MRKGFSLLLIFILIASLSTSSFVGEAFAERTSIFQKMSDAFKYPFQSAAMTVGWDGPIDKSPRHHEPPEQKTSFITIWMCKILQGDIEKITGKTPLGKKTMCDEGFLEELFN